MKFSAAPFVLPGRLTINVFPRIPAVSLDNIAIGVTDKDPDIIACTNPGASLSKIFFVASGVTSRGENPVPPANMFCVFF